MDATEESRTARNRPAVHEIALSWRDGHEEIIVVGESETVLDAAERAGVSLPFGCRTGACSTCTGRVLDGRVEYSRSPRALKSRHLDGGYALLCIAEPQADCRIEVGADIQSDLLSSPRK